MIDNTLLQRILQAHRLGTLHTISRPARGSINPCFIVNDAYVIRFTTLTDKGGSRFESERIAYDLLRESDVPVPEVVALDLSLKIAPYAYLITTRLPGAPVIDGWPEFTPAQQAHVAHDTGRYLAHIHSHPFDRFGKLRSLDFDRWGDYVADFLHRYTQQALQLGGLHAQEVDQLHAVLQRHQSVLDHVTEGALLHSDYHFENILQHEGVITGVIDFEWAYAGDPLADLVVADQWERTCPGSKAGVMAGYQSVRALRPDADIRLSIYQMLGLVESLVDHKKAGDEAASQATYAQLWSLVATLE